MTDDSSKVDTNNGEIKEVGDFEQTGFAIVALKDKVQILANGRIHIKNKTDAIDMWKGFVSDYWRQKLITALPGNRNAVMQKLNLFEEFIESDDRTEDAFNMLAMERGFNTERRAELWNEFMYFFQKQFTSWIKKQLTPMKQEKKDEGITLG